MSALAIGEEWRSEAPMAVSSFPAIILPQVTLACTSACWGAFPSLQGGETQDQSG